MFDFQKMIMNKAINYIAENREKVEAVFIEKINHLSGALCASEMMVIYNPKLNKFFQLSKLENSKAQHITEKEFLVLLGAGDFQVGGINAMPLLSKMLIQMLSKKAIKIGTSADKLIVLESDGNKDGNKLAARVYENREGGNVLVLEMFPAEIISDALDNIGDEIEE